MKFINIEQLKLLPKYTLLMKFDKNFLPSQLIYFIEVAE